MSHHPPPVSLLPGVASAPTGAIPTGLPQGSPGVFALLLASMTVGQIPCAPYTPTKAEEGATDEEVVSVFPSDTPEDTSASAQPILPTPAQPIVFAPTLFTPLAFPQVVPPVPDTKSVVQPTPTEGEKAMAGAAPLPRESAVKAPMTAHVEVSASTYAPPSFVRVRPEHTPVQGSGPHPIAVDRTVVSPDTDVPFAPRQEPVMIEARPVPDTQQKLQSPPIPDMLPNAADMRPAGKTHNPAWMDARTSLESPANRATREKYASLHESATHMPLFRKPSAPPPSDRASQPSLNFPNTSQQRETTIHYPAAPARILEFDGGQIAQNVPLLQDKPKGLPTGDRGLSNRDWDHPARDYGRAVFNTTPHPQQAQDRLFADACGQPAQASSEHTVLPYDTPRWESPNSQYRGPLTQSIANGGPFIPEVKGEKSWHTQPPLGDTGTWYQMFPEAGKGSQDTQRLTPLPYEGEVAHTPLPCKEPAPSRCSRLDLSYLKEGRLGDTSIQPPNVTEQKAASLGVAVAHEEGLISDKVIHDKAKTFPIPSVQCVLFSEALPRQRAIATPLDSLRTLLPKTEQPVSSRYATPVATLSEEAPRAVSPPLQGDSERSSQMCYSTLPSTPSLLKRSRLPLRPPSPLQGEGLGMRVEPNSLAQPSFLSSPQPSPSQEARAVHGDDRPSPLQGEETGMRVEPPVKICIGYSELQLLQSERQAPVKQTSNMSSPQSQVHVTPDALIPLEVPLDTAKKDTLSDNEALHMTTSSRSQQAVHSAFIDNSESEIAGVRKAHFKNQTLTSKAETATQAHTLSVHRVEMLAPVAPMRPPDVLFQDRLHIVEQVVRTLEALRLTHGEQRMTLHLQPEHLGDLRLSVVVEKEHVTAHILVESQIVRQAVEESKEQLRAALAQKGFTLDGLDVSLNHGNAERRFSSPLPESYLRPAPLERPILLPEPEPSVPLMQAGVHGRYASGRLDCVA